MNKPLILVVEDDAPIRNLITTTLKTQDYKYIAAATASEALQQATIHAPDVMLLDLGLPDLDGIEVIRRIRSWSAMPIIVISARSEDITRALLEMDMGVTLLSGTGAYKNLPTQVVMCAFGRGYIIPVKKLVQRIDPDAFVIVCDTHEILGEGFGTYDPTGL